MAGKSTLTARQRNAITALLTASTIGEAARTAGIGETTLYRWMREDAEFVAEYQRQADRILDANIAAIQQATGVAVEVLKKVLTDSEAGNMAKLTAARHVLEYAYRARDINLGKKLDELEKIVRAGTGAAGVEVIHYDNE